VGTNSKKNPACTCNTPQKNQEKTKTTNTCKHNHIEPQNKCQKITHTQSRKIPEKCIQNKQSHNQHKSHNEKSPQHRLPQLTIPNTPHIKSHKPKTKKTTKSTYTHPTKLLILLGGNNETNPGPTKNILQKHLQTHHDKHNTYFYKNTIQLKNEYNHLLEPTLQ
jgi:hypothetical protein